MPALSDRHAALLAAAITHLQAGELELAQDKVFESYRAAVSAPACEQLDGPELRARIVRVSLHELITEAMITRARSAVAIRNVERRLGFTPEWKAEHGIKEIDPTTGYRR